MSLGSFISGSCTFVTRAAGVFLQPLYTKNEHSVHIFDPKSVMAQLAYLNSKPGAKLHFSATKIHVQESGLHQIAIRSFNHVYNKTDQSSELHLLSLPIHTFIKWSQSEKDETNKLLTEMAIDGLKSLQKTYSDDPTAIEILQSYINDLKNQNPSNRIYPHEWLKILWSHPDINKLHANLISLHNKYHGASSFSCESDIRALEALVDEKAKKIDIYLQTPSSVQLDFFSEPAENKQNSSHHHHLSSKPSSPQPPLTMEEVSLAGPTPISASDIGHKVSNNEAIKQPSKIHHKK